VNDLHRCIIPIKAVPNASRSEVVGWLGDALRIRLKAPPVQGKANAELCQFFANELGLPKDAVRWVTGISARQKRVEITGISIDILRERFPI